MFEAVIVDAIRTPMGKRNGTLAQWHPTDLLGYVLTEIIDRNNIEHEVIEDVIIGCVKAEGEQSGNIARTAILSAGLPESIAGVTIDRACGSSLQALQFAAHGIMAGTYKAVIAGGIESMTRVPMNSSSGTGVPFTEKLLERYPVGKAIFSQYVGADLISEEIGLTREKIDAYSLKSHQKAAAAREKGYFDKEILPIPVQNEEGERVLFSQDETIRENTSLEKLAGLATAFEGLKTVTAGNSSQIADGSSAVLIMEKEFALSLGLKPRAIFKGFSVVGTDPIKMLKGPIKATELVLERSNLTMDDIDLVEINEAFSSVVLRWNHDIPIPLDKVNVNGGAIALGHALGSTGTRLVTTLLNELERQQKKYGLITLCEGPGMGNAMIIERVAN